MVVEGADEGEVEGDTERIAGALLRAFFQRVLAASEAWSRLATCFAFSSNNRLCS
jgi:hypothetical protein